MSLDEPVPLIRFCDCRATGSLGVPSIPEVMPDQASVHRHDFYTILWVTGGVGRHVVDFQEYELSPGNMQLVAPGQVH